MHGSKFYLIFLSEFSRYGRLGAASELRRGRGSDSLGGRGLQSADAEPLRAEPRQGQAEARLDGKTYLQLVFFSIASVSCTGNVEYSSIFECYQRIISHFCLFVLWQWQILMSSRIVIAKLYVQISFCDTANIAFKLMPCKYIILIAIKSVPTGKGCHFFYSRSKSATAS